jgi:hypothetical protein
MTIPPGVGPEPENGPAQLARYLSLISYEVLSGLARRHDVDVPAGATKEQLVALICNTIPDEVQETIRNVFRAELDHAVDRLTKQIEKTSKQSSASAKYLVGTIGLVIAAGSLGALYQFARLSDLGKNLEGEIKQREYLDGIQREDVAETAAKDLSACLARVYSTDLVDPNDIPKIQRIFETIGAMTKRGSGGAQNAIDLKLALSYQVADALLKLPRGETPRLADLDRAKSLWMSFSIVDAQSSILSDFARDVSANSHIIISLLDLMSARIAETSIDQRLEWLKDSDKQLASGIAAGADSGRVYNLFGLTAVRRSRNKPLLERADELKRAREFYLRAKTYSEGHLKTIVDNNRAYTFVRSAQDKAEMSQPLASIEADIDTAEKLLRATIELQVQDQIVFESLAEVLAFRIRIVKPEVTHWSSGKRRQYFADIVRNVIIASRRSTKQCDAYVKGMKNDSDILSEGLFILKPDFDWKGLCAPDADEKATLL